VNRTWQPLLAFVGCCLAFRVAGALGARSLRDCGGGSRRGPLVRSEGGQVRGLDIEKVRAEIAEQEKQAKATA